MKSFVVVFVLATFLPDDIDAMLERVIHSSIRSTLPHAINSLRLVTDVNKESLKKLRLSGETISSHLPGRVGQISDNALNTIEEANNIALGATENGMKSMEYTNVLTDGNMSGFQRMKATAGLTASGTKLLNAQMRAAALVPGSTEARNLAYKSIKNAMPVVRETIHRAHEVQKKGRPHLKSVVDTAIKHAPGPVKGHLGQLQRGQEKLEQLNDISIDSVKNSVNVVENTNELANGDGYWARTQAAMKLLKSVVDGAYISYKTYRTVQR